MMWAAGASEISWNRAGYCTLRAARAMRMWPDSSGSRRVSSALRFHSGSSSRKRTPWWASDISPGQGGLPLSFTPNGEKPPRRKPRLEPFTKAYLV